jgi:hypothetical protein
MSRKLDETANNIQCCLCFQDFESTETLSQHLSEHFGAKKGESLQARWERENAERLEEERNARLWKKWKLMMG